MWQDTWAAIAASSRNEQADHRLGALGGIPEDPYDAARLDAQPAGTRAGMFLPSFVPIAEDQSGSDMFVDTRSGRWRGCVTEFVKGDVDTWGSKWPSVAAMLADLAEGLQAGRPVGRWQPIVNHGRLDWEASTRAVSVTHSRPC
jgi:hypothetical protein